MSEVFVMQVTNKDYTKTRNHTEKSFWRGIVLSMAVINLHLVEMLIEGSNDYMSTTTWIVTPSHH